MLALLCGSTACSGGLLFGDSEADIATEIAEEYLTAIVEGRAEDAHGMLTDPGFEPMPDEVYVETEHRVTDYTVDEVTGTTLVEGALLADDGWMPYELHIDVETGEITDPGTWRLLSYAITLETAVPLINGTGIPGRPVAGPDGVISLQAPPGVYVLDAEVGNLLTVEEQTVDLGVSSSGESTSGPRLRPTLSEEGSELAQQQVDELLERCLEDISGEDASCPNQLPSGSDPDPRSVEWTLLEPPTVQWRSADGDHVGGTIEYGQYFSATWTEDGEPAAEDALGWGSDQVEARVDGEDELSVEITDLG